MWNWRWLTSPLATRLEQIAASHGWDPNAIAAVIDIETGGTASPTVENPKSHAIGLIQFLPSTAENLGTSTAALRKMSAVDQLAYVEKYFAKVLAGYTPQNPGDYYVATFMPSYLGRADSDVIATEGETVYEQNAGLDADQSGEITVGDVRAVLRRVYDSAATRGSFDPTKTQAPRETSHLSQGQGLVVAGGLLLVVGWIFVRTLRPGR